MKLLIATHNLGKFREIERFLSGLNVALASLQDFPNLQIPEENGASYSENAGIKAEQLARQTGLCALADDSGLEVEGLDWQPGIHSARWAGLHASDQEKNEKLLLELQKTKGSRRAVFCCVLAFCIPGEGTHLFSGELWGNITKSPRGNNGFGYDPIFLPLGFDRTLAEMSPEEKNLISHRAKALDRFKEFLVSRFC